MKEFTSKKKRGKGGFTIGGHAPGWQYETKPKENIESSAQYYNKYEKGTIAEADLHKVDQICGRIPMPKDEYRAGIRIRKDCRNWVRDALDELEKERVFTGK
jgi:hypothetical protein